MATMQMQSRTQVAANKRSQTVAAPCLHATSSTRVTRSAFSSGSSRQAKAFAPITPCTSRTILTRAAAAPEAPTAQTAQKEWYALVASAEFFFNDVQNESVAEQLRERVRFFKEQNREHDFFIVPEPKWLDAKYPEQAKKVKRPAVALVSSDKNWIVFMKLRLDRVLRIDLGPITDAEALAVGGEIPEFKSSNKWTAPYPPYASGWWNVFVPKH